MSGFSKHINNALSYDESQKELNVFHKTQIDQQKKNIYNKDLLDFNIRHKLKRIKREIKFAKKHYLQYKKLTQREKEIISLLAAGNNNPKIAEKLYISRCTVEQHRKNINAKLGVTSFSQLMPYIYAFDII